MRDDQTTDRSIQAFVADERPSSAQVAVIGCGHWGKNLVRNFAELGAIAAVSDSEPVTVRKHADTYGVPARTWPEILRDEAIPAVAVAAPAALHASMTRDALKSGKDVFVEKPLALEAREAEELCALAESRGRILMVGHLLQYHPAFLALKDTVEQGKLGRLQYIYSNRLNLGKVRREENILWSFAPHDISMILALVGEQPEAVEAVGATYLHKAIADVTTTHLHFPSGVQAHVFVSWLHPFKEQKLVVVGDRAMAVFDDGEPWQRKLLLYPHLIEWINGQPRPARADPVAVPVEPDEPLKLECRHFLECVAARRRPRTDGREGLRVLQVLQAAEQAMSTGGGLQRAKPADPVWRARWGAAADGVMIHESAYVDQPCSIGAGTRIWHFSHVLKNVTIGQDCVIGQNVMVGPDVTVGAGCKIQNNVSLYKGVTLEDGVFCGPSCVFTNVSNPRAEVERKDEFRPTVVRRGTTIGANATIVCGHEIGAYSLIAAGAVVTKDVPPHALMAGVPARRIGWVSHAGERLGPDLVCPRTGQRYREAGTDRLEEIRE
jgi:predicted dehydrogenase/acetyltransferase-like isoleucine patch superfamily enzyme